MSRFGHREDWCDEIHATRFMAAASRRSYELDGAPGAKPTHRAVMLEPLRAENKAA
ncbi:hypothetical protein IG197_19985 [Aminobacter sp. SR38]|jgi:hypothetical protein|uniref:hypothetical protein n=1 Tax=unclassified Aminobacter TaxID=2644704 RepID=UPI0012B01BCF|nr:MULTISPECIES: hypothetical protein [unclassified Aminobacter]MRX37043.1 hypothetical protein [Aminobacter sp. MDW-2]QNH35020.1 hypothetical protein H5P29_03530 [Aminobacter sp. MDW-2]QOF70095.1 hypothetical protein IG197_19985 [Aminobacter sp. SR38]